MTDSLDYRCSHTADLDPAITADILNSILPSITEDDAPSSFTQTGHIGRSFPSSWHSPAESVHQVMSTSAKNGFRTNTSSGRSSSMSVPLRPS